MPQEGLSMRKVKEVLSLRFDRKRPPSTVFTWRRKRLRGRPGSRRLKSCESFVPELVRDVGKEVATLRLSVEELPVLLRRKGEIAVHIATLES